LFCCSSPLVVCSSPHLLQQGNPSSHLRLVCSKRVIYSLVSVALVGLHNTVSVWSARNQLRFGLHSRGWFDSPAVVRPPTLQKSEYGHNGMGCKAQGCAHGGAADRCVWWWCVW
jgi:hypothetical protein